MKETSGARASERLGGSKVYFGAGIALAALLAGARADAQTVFVAPEGYQGFQGSYDGQVTGQWDSPIRGKPGNNLLDLVYRQNAICVARPAWDVPSDGSGCGGQCVELASRWFSLYVYADHPDDSVTWIHGDGGAGYCACARGECGSDGSLYDVRNWGDRYVPRLGDVVSFSYTHAAVVTHVWADDGGIHMGLANQNFTMTTVLDWKGDHYDDESCIVHPVGMPQFQRPPAYAADVDGDGKADVCGRAGDGIYCWPSTGAAFGEMIKGPAWSDANGWWLPRFDATIQFPDIDGDGKADVCGRAGNGVICNKSLGTSFGPDIEGPAWSDDAGWGAIQYYSTIRFPDIDGDGKADVCGRNGGGITCQLSTGDGFGAAIAGPAWADSSNWDQPPYVSTIQFPDINGDGKADACARGAAGVECWLSNGAGFPTMIQGPAWSDHNGWGRDYHYGTIQFPDLDGDGKADICGRAGNGIVCQLSTGDGFGPDIAGPAWSNDNGWIAPRYWYTIQFLDIDGDHRQDICGRAGDGMHCALWTGAGFGPEFLGPEFGDDTGWYTPQYFMTIGSADVNADGKADLCARGSGGTVCALSDGAGFSTAVTGPALSDDYGWGLLRYYGTLRFLGQPRYAKAGDLPFRPDPDRAADADPDEEGNAAEDLPAGPLEGGCACTTAGFAPSTLETLSPWAIAALGLAIGRRRRRARA